MTTEVLNLVHTKEYDEKESVKCCSRHRAKSNFNFNTGEHLFGSISYFCKSPYCLFEPCIRFRCSIKHNKYKNAFDDNEKIYFFSVEKLYIDEVSNGLKNTFKKSLKLRSSKKTEESSVGIMKETMVKLFHKTLCFDCFDHVECYMARPKDKVLSDIIFKEVDDFNQYLKKTTLYHMICKDKDALEEADFDEDDAYRVRKYHIHVNKPTMKMATINGYYARDNGETEERNGRRVIMRIPCRVNFQMDVGGKVMKDFNYPEMLNSIGGIQFLKDFYGFNDYHFNEKYSKCNDCKKWYECEKDSNIFRHL